ncbi:MAG: galactose-1-phosphate uridylyltransferase [Planctomycetes bacterium]|nr:galactose-1-phosphate uridylyltransferase [Planctomycetota bacterium]
MPELRKDPITGRWIIIASERAKRPIDFKAAPATLRGAATCPFCEGNEASTPPEISAMRYPNTRANDRGWRVRVVSNKFPALRVEGDLDKRGEGLYDIMNGIGAHEVIIEHPTHKTSLTGLTEEEIREVIWVYRDRLQDLKKDVRLLYGLVFKNVGETAGASLEHSHSQLIVTPVVPQQVQQEMQGGKHFLDYRGRCLFCDIIKQEIETGDRIVVSEPNFVSFAPFASRFPFETWIMPKRHMTHFENLPQHLIADLAHILKATLAKIEGALANPAYNYLIHTTPFDVGEVDYYHWHIEIIPRITRVAGFEWGTGFYINPVPPENAAAFLREVRIS